MTPAEIVLLLLLLSRWSKVHEQLFDLASRCCYRWGAFRTTRVLVQWLRLLPISGWMDAPLRRMAVYAHEGRGNTEAAVAGAWELADHAVVDGCWPCANCAVNAFINAGLYREALEVEPGGRRLLEDEAPSDEEVLVRFNQVEAVYNLGGWAAANARLRELEDTANRIPLLRTFLPVQRGWILAHTGRGREALDGLSQVDPRHVPGPYASEVCFTRAAALLALERYDEAEREAREGLALARRASSSRNGLFLLGRIALGAGRLEEAARLFEQGAAHPYKGQGGDALLAWGDCLAQLGRPAEAREAWRLVLERDSQSGAARVATSRLGADGDRQERGRVEGEGWSRRAEEGR